MQVASVSPASSVVAHLARARSWLALELPGFAAWACVSPPLPRLPPRPPRSPCCHHPSGLRAPGSEACAAPSARKSPCCRPRIPLLGELLSPPTAVPSRPCVPPGTALITLRVYLWDYLTHVSLHQAANSVRVGTESVLFTDNPRCLAHSRASNFFK